MFAHSQRVTHISMESTTMSRITHPSASCMLTGGVLLAAVCLIAPAEAHAQSVGAEQAMRNVSTFGPSGTAAVNAAPDWTIDGAWALLSPSPARTPGGARLATESTEAVRPVDGTRALLVRASLPERTSR